MGYGLVDRGAGRAQLREFGLGPVTLKHINGSEGAGGALVGGGALQDGPVDPADGALVGGIRHILEAAVDNRFEAIELGLGLAAALAAIALAPPIFPLTKAALVARSAAIARGRGAFLAGASLAAFAAAMLALGAFLVRPATTMAAMARGAIRSSFPRLRRWRR